MRTLRCLFLLIFSAAFGFIFSNILLSLYNLYQKDTIKINKPIKPKHTHYINYLNWSELISNYSEANANTELEVSEKCNMETCFDFSACQSGFKVYVYPPSPNQKEPSLTYSKILTALYNSKYITHDPYEACIFIPSLDTLDRDPLGPYFDPNLSKHLLGLPYWNSLPRRDFHYESNHQRNQNDLVAKSNKTAGRNHLIFNFYAGTWPDYREEDYRLSLGQAMLAKASFSTTHFRSKFDISLPLIHPEHPASTQSNAHFGNTTYMRAILERSYLLSFKGKRYVHGIGSASRNSLFHLNNGRDIILLTTCRHGAKWILFADERCPADMALYDALW